MAIDSPRNAPRRNIFAQDTPLFAGINARQNSPFLPRPSNGIADAMNGGVVGGGGNGYQYAAPSINPGVNLNNLTPQFQDINIDPVRPAPAAIQQNSMQALNDALNRRSQQARMDVGVRQQEQLERGVGGALGDGRYLPQDINASAKFIGQNVPASQLEGFKRYDSPGNEVMANFTKVIPGIGHVTDVVQKDGGEGKVMTGRYGTGSATLSDKPRTGGGTITENGKQVPIAGWFKDAARSQGESNKFYSKGGVQMTDRV